MSDVAALSALELRERIAQGSVAAVEATRAYLDRIARLDARLHAFLHVDEAGALARAAEVDAALGRGEAVGPLAGAAARASSCARPGAVRSARSGQSSGTAWVVGSTPAVSRLASVAT